MASDKITAHSQAAPWVGPFFGLLGVLAFSGTLPATRLAVPVFGPTFLTSSRILLAALLSAICVLAFRYAFPKRRHFKSIVWMAMGLAVAYPFFVALAMGSVPAAHGVVVTGLAPAATAVLAIFPSETGSGDALGKLISRRRTPVDAQHGVTSLYRTRRTMPG